MQIFEYKMPFTKTAITSNHVFFRRVLSTKFLPERVSSTKGRFTVAGIRVDTAKLDKRDRLLRIRMDVSRRHVMTEQSRIDERSQVVNGKTLRRVEKILR